MIGSSESKLLVPRSAPTADRQPDRDASRLWAVLGLLAVLVLLTSRIGGFELIDPDEGRYAEIPREMIESGDWVTPRLDYVDYFEKPPLLYWLVALSFEAFGRSEGAARLVPALSGVATLALTYLLGTWTFRRRSALLGTGILLTAPLFFAFSQALVIDMLLTACVTAALVAAHRAHVSDRKHPWVELAAAACALGVLAKGPVALVLPGATTLVYLLLQRDWDTIRALLSWRPIVLFVVVVAPWFLLVSARNPGFAEFFFVREHLQRFAADVGHPEGPFYYVPVVLLGALPWTVVFGVLGLDGEALRALRGLPRDPRAFLSIWAFVVLGFFTLARSKLAGYVLPAFPPLAILAGAWLDELGKRPERAVKVLRGTLAGLAAVGGTIAVVAVVARFEAAEVSPWLRLDPDAVRSATDGLLPFGVVLIGGWILERTTRAVPRRVAPTAAWLIGTLALALFGAVGGRGAAPSSKTVGRVASSVVPPGGRLVSYRTLRQGLAFYYGARVIQAEYEGELEFGAAASSARDRWFWHDEDLERVARDGENVWIVSPLGHVENLRARLRSPLPVLAEDDGLALLECAPCGPQKDG